MVVECDRAVDLPSRYSPGSFHNTIVPSIHHTLAYLDCVQASKQTFRESSYELYV